MFFTVKADRINGDEAILGFDTATLSKIEKSSDNSILFASGNNHYYYKSFSTDQDRNDYFDYIASKLEVINLSDLNDKDIFSEDRNLIRLKWKDEQNNTRDTIINLSLAYETTKEINRIYLYSRNETYIFQYKDKISTDKYFDYLMEKLRAIKLEEKPLQSNG